MTKRKGMTLVEVVVSIGLLSMIFAFFSGILVNQYRSMMATRSITKDQFAATEALERAMLTARDDLDKGRTPAATKKSYTLFSGANRVTVDVWELYATIEETPQINGAAGRRILTAVSDRKIVSIPAPSIVSLTTKLENKLPTINSVFSNTPGAKITSAINMDIPPGVKLKLTTYQWFISRPGFNTIRQPGLVEQDAQLFPLFPDDYILLKGEVGDSLQIRPEYAGRQIILGATPAAETGKLGAQVFSDPIYIMAPPSTNQLIAYYDASLTDFSSSVRTATVGSETIQYAASVNNIISSASNMVAADAASQPVLKSEEFGKITVFSENGITSEKFPIYSRYLSFNGSQAVQMQNATGNYPEMTVFTVARTSQKDASTIVSLDGEIPWSLDFKGLHNSGDIVSLNGAAENKWQLIGMRLGNTDEDITVDPDSSPESGTDSSGSTAPPAPSTPGSTGRRKFTYFYNNSPLDLAAASRVVGSGSNVGGKLAMGMSYQNGNSKVDVAEVLIFSYAMDDTEIQNMREYLMKKYGIIG